MTTPNAIEVAIRTAYKRIGSKSVVRVDACPVLETDEFHIDITVRATITKQDVQVLLSDAEVNVRKVLSEWVNAALDDAQL